MADKSLSFLERHAFLIRRLHSLTGLIPVGAYLCVHLTVNASVLNSPETFQSNVYAIHALDRLLPVVEWTFIFLPILFHAAIGFVIIAGGLPNQKSYPYARNWQYTLQRWTGVVAFLFIAYHVFHMHGWIHADWWITHVAEPLGGAQFRAFNATSTAATALENTVVAAAYAVGVLASVYHLANGVWTMGITWGVWITPKSQTAALRVCAVGGVLLAVVGLSALGGMRAVAEPRRLQEVRQREYEIYEHRVEAGMVRPNEHKLVEPEHADPDSPAESGEES